MNRHDISTLIHFNFWANDQILSTCKQLTTEEFKREVIPNPGWGSLRGILVHTLDTEYGWRTALQQLPDAILEESDFPDVMALTARWASERTAWLDYVAGLNDGHLNQRYSKTAQDSPTVWQTIMHVVMHSIQHRSEAGYILTGYGYSPGELDFGIFLRESSLSHD